MSRARTSRPIRAPSRVGVAEFPREAKRAVSRAESELSIDDDQLLGAEALGGVPAAVAIAAAGESALVALRTVVEAVGQRVVAIGVGDRGCDAAVAALRGATPPGVIFVATTLAETVLRAARTVEPRPVVVLTASSPARTLAQLATALDADLFAASPFDLDRTGPVAIAGARLAQARTDLYLARGREALARGRLDQLVASDATTGLQSFELFQRVLELELKRARRYGYSLTLAVVELLGPRAGAGGADRILRVRAAAALVAEIRDIDLATELDDGRYLVLLPYTERAAGGQIAHRIVRAIAAQPPVVVAGAALACTARAGVAGGREAPGDARTALATLSFARLMKEANAALGLAKRDGAELVVWT